MASVVPTADSTVKRFLRQPEVRQNIIMVVLVDWREYQHECDYRLQCLLYKTEILQLHIFLPAEYTVIKGLVFTIS